MSIINTVYAPTSEKVTESTVTWELSSCTHCMCLPVRSSGVIFICWELECPDPDPPRSSDYWTDDSLQTKAGLIIFNPCWNVGCLTSKFIKGENRKSDIITNKELSFHRWYVNKRMYFWLKLLLSQWLEMIFFEQVEEGALRCWWDHSGAQSGLN